MPKKIAYVAINRVSLIVDDQFISKTAFKYHQYQSNKQDNMA